MGTDMHVLVEVSHRGEAWHPLAGESMPLKAPRQYPLFALLGDSRNHAGRHAPIWQEPRTIQDQEGNTHEVPGWWYKPDDGGHDRITPISAPRGVPEDASVLWQAFVLAWQSREPTMDVTWVTLDDIIGADWDQVVMSYGVLQEPEYLKLAREGIIPDQHPLNAGGPGVLKVSEIEYAEGLRGETMTVVDARWRSGPMRELHGDFLELCENMRKDMPDSSKLRFMLLFES